VCGFESEERVIQEPMISYADLKARWPGFTWRMWRDAALASIFRRPHRHNFPDAYIIIEKRIANDGNTVFICEDVGAVHAGPLENYDEPPPPGATELSIALRDGDEICSDDLFYIEREVRECEQKTQNKWYTARPLDGTEQPATLPVSEAESHARAWEAEAEKRKKKDHKACLLAAAKWEGLNHYAAYDKAIGNTVSPSSKNTYVSNAKATAQKIADDSQDRLTMPEWDTGG